jgi:AcrR family transcriptional regulator
MARPPSTDDRIHTAVLELLRSRGPGAVTVESVTALSGVAKTTIYRRYADRREMLAGALAPLSTPPLADDEFDPRQRLTWIIDRAVASIEHGIGFGVMAALLTDEDVEFSETFRSILARYRQQISAAIDDAKSSGEFRADLDNDTLVDGIVGAYVAERGRLGHVEGWRQRLFELFWPTVEA